MKNFLLLITFLASMHLGFAQKEKPTQHSTENKSALTNKQIYYEDVVYVQLKPSFRKSAQYKKDIDMIQEAPFLQKHKASLGLQKMEKPFYFAKDQSIAFTYKLYFDKKTSLEKVLATLALQPEIAYVEKVPISFIPEHNVQNIVPVSNGNQLKNTNLGSNDPYYGDCDPINITAGSLVYGTKWFLDRIQAEAAWSLFTPLNSSPIKVAVVDGAVYTAHEDLKIVSSYDAETKALNSSPPATGDAYEWSHGTHCAGLVSAVTNNSLGIPSIGQNLEVIGVKTGRNSDGALIYFYEGLLYAIQETDAKVISLSVGSYGYSLTEQNIINQAYEKDIVVLAAASNDDISNKSYPAAYEHVIAVGSTSADDKKSDFSNYGDWVDIMAPGGNLSNNFYLLLSTTFADASNEGMGIEANSSPINGRIVSGKYHMMAGTSMATPVAAGLVGLMRAANPALNADQIEAILKRTSDNIDNKNPGFSGFLGSGRINAKKAIETIQQSNSLIAVPSYSALNISPGTTINFEDKSLGNPIAWEWTFTGPVTLSSSLQNPNIQFDVAGNYEFRLVVFNASTSDTTYLTQPIKVGTSTNIEAQVTGFAQASRGINFISVVDNNNVWALAYDGANTDNYIQDFAVTTDGGSNWIARSFNQAADLVPAMIFGISGTKAYAPMFKTGTSEQGIFITTDGGANWTRQSTAAFNGIGSFPNVVYFWNENEGVCMGDPDGGYFEIYTTSNGGSNWTRVANTGNTLTPSSTEEYGTIGYFSAADDGTFFFNTNKGRIFKTLDKGKTWTSHNTPLSGGNKIAFSSKDYGLLLDYTTSKLYVTSDGANTWKEVSVKGHFYPNQLAYVPGSKNMFVSADADYQNSSLGLSLSTDGGKTWKDIPELTEQQCLAIGFADISTGWIGEFSQSIVAGGMIKYSGPHTFPSFEASNDFACADQNSKISFTNKTSTGIENPTYYWDFGADATPANANTAGPHEVSYASSGERIVKLTVNEFYTYDFRIIVNEPAILGDIYYDTTRVCQGTPVEISLINSAGKVEWQKAVLQSNTFSASQSEYSGSFDFISEPIEDTTYFKAKVYAEGCNELYSDIIRIDVSRIKSDYSWSRNAYDVTFMDLSENAASYTWFFGDGSTSQDASPVHKYNADGDYMAKLLVENEEACLDSIEKSVKVNVTAIGKTELSNQIKIYPNPSKAIFFLEWIEYPGEDASYSITTINGKTIDKQKMTNQKTTINLEGLPQGLYFLKIESKKGIALYKLMLN